MNNGVIFFKHFINMCPINTNENVRYSIPFEFGDERDREIRFIFVVSSDWFVVEIPESCHKHNRLSGRQAKGMICAIVRADRVHRKSSKDFTLQLHYNH